MEEKEIVILSMSENAILGQLSTFGWEMKDKENAGKFLFYKYTKYKLIRDRKPENVTQAHLDVENRWNSEFAVWNQWILHGLKKIIVAMIVEYLFIIVGFILIMVGSEILWVGLALFITSLCISIPMLVINVKNGTRRLKKMNQISCDMRKVNSLRK